MITQYVRLSVDTITDEIRTCTSQTFPFIDSWQPVASFLSDGSLVAVNHYDFEIDTDYPDSDFGAGVVQNLLRAGQILDNFEIVGGQPQLKAAAVAEVSAKVMRVSSVKSIEEADIRLEMSATIKTSLESGGSNEAELLDEMRKVDIKTPTTIDELSTIKIIRLHKAL